MVFTMIANLYSASRILKTQELHGSKFIVNQNLVKLSS